MLKNRPHKVIYWIVPILYILFAHQFYAGLGITNELHNIIAFKAGLALLIITGLLKSGKITVAGLSPRINWRVVVLYWPIILLIIWQFSSTSALPSVGYILKTLLLSLLIGFIEEVVFRGMLFYWLRKQTKIKIIFYSSLIFGLVHAINFFSGDDYRVVLLQVFVAFSLGLVFAVARMKDHSIWLLIIAHALIDWSDFVSAGINSNMTFNDETFVMWMLPGVIFFCWGLYHVYRISKEEERYLVFK